MQPQPAHLDDGLVLEQVVVGVEHRRVLGGDTDLVTGVAHGRDGLDVVPVAVGLEHRAHPQGAAQVEQAVVLVGGVEEHGVAGLLAAQDEDVVVHGTHHDLVDLGLGVLVVQGVGSHVPSLPGRDT